jgi:hypothetical protein
LTPNPAAAGQDRPTHTRTKRMEAQLNLDDVKNGLKRLMPVIETVARLTPNKIDDMAVLFLKAILADPVKMAAAVDAAK